LPKIKNNQGRVIGSHKNGKGYFKRSEGSHTLNITDAWCLDISALTQLINNKVHTIEIEATDTGVFFSIDISTFQAEGTQYSFGYGDQICLPKKYWRKRHIGAKSPLSTATQLEMQLRN